MDTEKWAMVERRVLSLTLDQIAKKMPTWHIHRRILNN